MSTLVNLVSLASGVHVFLRSSVIENGWKYISGLVPFALVCVILTIAVIVFEWRRRGCD
jgi:hypothetical protein